MGAIQQGAKIFNVTLPAGADLSEAQFKFVAKSAGTYVLTTSTTDIPSGVLQNKPGLGEPCEVLQFGPTKMWSGGAIAADSQVGPDSSGRAVARSLPPASAGTDAICGRAQVAASAADRLFAGIVDCINGVMGQ